MTNKLHTSSETQKIFLDIGKSSGLQAYILAKIAISLSIKNGKLKDEDYKSDNDGLELSRSTIFGDYDLLYKSLIINCEQEALAEDEYFPRMVKAHLDRGAKLLSNEKRYTRNFYSHLCHLDTNI